jgi:hypothetical protein
MKGLTPRFYCVFAAAFTEQQPLPLTNGMGRRKTENGEEREGFCPHYAVKGGQTNVGSI